jgi:hypothetical protein
MQFLLEGAFPFHDHLDAMCGDRGGGGRTMFSRVQGKYEIECDSECGAVLKTGLTSFHQARNLSVVEGWEHRPVGRREWRNYCPRCAAETMNPDLDRVGVYFFKASGE